MSNRTSEDIDLFSKPVLHPDDAVARSSWPAHAIAATTTASRNPSS